MNIEALLRETRPEKGLVPLSVFTNPEIYERELQTIFKKSWLFLGFESMVRNKGDYIRTSMGEIPVIVIRDQDEKVRVFLDICPHKGMQLVRGYIGNSLFLKCPYHGWTFSADGKLISAPYYEEGYAGIINKEEWGLKEVKNVKLYKGTIWATLDERPKKSFEEYLGDMKLYLDLILDMFEGEIEVYGGIRRWLIPTNWRVPAENVSGDTYHTLTTHSTAAVIGLRPKEFSSSSNNRIIYLRGGHSVLSYKGGRGKYAVDVDALRSFRERLEKWIEILSHKYGSFVKDIFPYYVFIFPNFVIFTTWNFIRFDVYHPRGLTRTIMETGLMIFKDMPEETKRAVLGRMIHESSLAGLINQDDADMWIKVTSNADRVRKHGINFDFNYMRGLGKEMPAEELIGNGAKGMVVEHFSENGIRNFYDTWKKYLLGEEP